MGRRVVQAPRALLGEARGRRGRSSSRRGHARRGVHGARAGAGPALGGDPRPCASVLRRGAHRAGAVARGAGATLGVVTSIAGMAGIEIVFAGRRGHAGTGADEPAVGRPRRGGRIRAPGARCRAQPCPVPSRTVGGLDVSPGATNTIPGQVELFADLRAGQRSAGRAGRRARQAHRHAPRAPACQGRGHPALALRARGDRPEPSEGAGAGHRRRRSRAGRAALRAPGTTRWDGGERGGRSGFSLESDAEGVSHAPEETTGADAVAAAVGRARGGAARATPHDGLGRGSRNPTAARRAGRRVARANARRAEGAARPRASSSR